MLGISLGYTIHSTFRNRSLLGWQKKGGKNGDGENCLQFKFVLQSVDDFLHLFLSQFSPQPNWLLIYVLNVYWFLEVCYDNWYVKRSFVTTRWIMSSGMSILMVIRFLLVSYLHYFPSKQAALMILERGNNCIEIKNEKGKWFFVVPLMFFQNWTTRLNVLQMQRLLIFVGSVQTIFTLHEFYGPLY